MGPIIFADFDGTIAQVDVTDAILNKFARPEWREAEEEWLSGRIGSRECLRRQMALVRASADELNALIDSVPLDPGFRRFLCWTRKQHIPFYVVSDGFDYVIRRILRRCGGDGQLLSSAHLFSSSMRVENGTIAVGFHHQPAACVHGCATCKPEVIRRQRAGHSPVVFVGDGLSDRFAVGEADIVFAKDKLLAYCSGHGLAATPFSTFIDIERDLRRRVDLPGTCAAHQAYARRKPTLVGV